MEKSYSELPPRGVLVSAESKRKLGVVIENACHYAILLGNRNENFSDYGFVPGLGMSTEFDRLRAEVEELAGGVFKMLVMGKFKNGKSTFINALVGAPLMAMNRTACTAVIATVEYGTREDEVRVVYSADSGKEPRVISSEQFIKEFALTEEDDKVINDGGIIERFIDIDHVEMQSSAAIFAGGMRLIDSPGLEDRASCTKVTLDYLPNANAIIFMLNATDPFSAAEKDFIQKHFAYKHLKNVFFVINRFDQVRKGERKDFISRVKTNLEDAFRDANGRFDDELYNHRVFFLSAYRALCARLDKPYDEVEIDGKPVALRAKLETTGMPEFERGLRTFLNSEERLNALMSTILKKMSAMYVRAFQKVEDDKKFRALDIDERKRRAEAAKKYLQRARRIIDNGNDAARTAVVRITDNIYGDLLIHITERIPSNFKQYIRNENVQDEFGVGDLFQLTIAGFINMFSRERAQARARSVLEPFVRRVNEYVETQMTIWEAGVRELISMEITSLSDLMKSMSNQFSIQINEARNVLIAGLTLTIEGYANETVQKNLREVLDGLDRNLEIDSILEEAFDADLSGKIISAALAAISTSIVLFLFGTIGLIVAFLITMIFNDAQFPTKTDMLDRMGQVIFNRLAENVSADETKIKARLKEPFNKKIDEIKRILESVLKDAEDNLNTLLSADDAQSTAVAAENARVDQCLAKMRLHLGAIYAEIHQHQPTDDEFKQMLLEAHSS